MCGDLISVSSLLGKLTQSLSSCEVTMVVSSSFSSFNFSWVCNVEGSDAVSVGCLVLLEYLLVCFITGSVTCSIALVFIGSCSWLLVISFSVA